MNGSQGGRKRVRTKAALPPSRRKIFFFRREGRETTDAVFDWEKKRGETEGEKNED